MAAESTADSASRSLGGTVTFGALPSANFPPHCRDFCLHVGRRALVVGVVSGTRGSRQKALFLLVYDPLARFFGPMRARLASVRANHPRFGERSQLCRDDLCVYPQTLGQFRMHTQRDQPFIKVRRARNSVATVFDRLRRCCCYRDRAGSRSGRVGSGRVGQRARGRTRGNGIRAPSVWNSVGTPRGIPSGILIGVRGAPLAVSVRLPLGLHLSLGGVPVQK